MDESSSQDVANFARVDAVTVQVVLNVNGDGWGQTGAGVKEAVASALDGLRESSGSNPV